MISNKIFPMCAVVYSLSKNSLTIEISFNELLFSSRLSKESYYGTIMTQNHPHTAISTWSGFVYQGKVALYHCLKKIVENYDLHHHLRLQLESEDDFAIYDQSQCISIHQVKAYKSTLFSGYQSSIEKQKVTANNGAYQNVYFHVARQIRDIPTTFDTDFHPVRFYSYPSLSNAATISSKAYCPLNEIDELIDDQIKILARDTNEVAPWKEHIATQIRKNLEAIINSKVVQMHHLIHESLRHQTAIAAQEFVEFSEIYNLINTDDLAQYHTENYFLNRLQIDIGSYYYEFCEQLPDQPQVIYNKLDNYIHQITRFDATEMKRFLNAIMPHRKGKFSTISDYKDQTIDRDSMRQGLFSIFHNLTQANSNSNRDAPFTWYLGGKFYFPTGIHTAAENQDIVCHDILQRAVDDDVEFLFERGSLVTTAINKPSITHVKFGISSENENKSGTSISSYQQVELVSLNNLPTSLFDEEIN